MAAPGFWDNPETAQEAIQELKTITDVLKPLAEVSSAGEDVAALVELAEEAGSPEVEAELRHETERVEKLLRTAELRAMLAGPHDHRGAFVTIQAGAGGTDACDW